MKRSRYLILLLATALGLGFGSCLKDKPFLDVSGTAPVIEFGQSVANGIVNDSTGYKGAFFFEGDPTVPAFDTAIALILASPQVLNDSISVTIALDPTQFAGWNAQGDTVTMIPDSVYSMSQLTVGISPQHRIGNIPVHISLAKFPATYAWGLPIKIVSAADVTHPNTTIVVSANAGTFMWIFEPVRI